MSWIMLQAWFKNQTLIRSEKQVSWHLPVVTGPLYLFHMPSASWYKFSFAQCLPVKVILLNTGLASIYCGSWLLCGDTPHTEYVGTQILHWRLVNLRQQTQSFFQKLTLPHTSTLVLCVTIGGYSQAQFVVWLGLCLLAMLELWGI